MKTLSIGMLAVVLVLHCAKAKERIDAAITNADQEKTYSITGIVSEINRQNNTITMSHDDIPSVTRGVNNTYELRGQNVESLDFSGPGGSFVTATLHKRGSKFWLTDVTRASR